MDLVIVESPSKISSLSSYLPDSFEVKASYGHIRDLPATKDGVPSSDRSKWWAHLGVDIDDDFRPIWTWTDESEERVQTLQRGARQANTIYLATDDDREGEAISAHLQTVLEADDQAFERMTFHEITKSAVQQSLQTTRSIDQDLVDAQEARRILDRIVGYELSDLLADKIAWGLTIGRVQVAATRLLVDRERIRRDFDETTYTSVEVDVSVGGESHTAELVEWGGRQVASSDDFDRMTGALKSPDDVVVLSPSEAEGIVDDIRSLRVESVEHRDYTTSPPKPFTTSALQRKAHSALGLSSSQTMGMAQDLYENGLITYMRTDNPGLAKSAAGYAKGIAENMFDDDAVGDHIRSYQASSSAEGAHEAIRPAGDSWVAPNQCPGSGRKRSLYGMIWKRTVASQMQDAAKTTHTVALSGTSKGKGVRFELTDRTVRQPGYIQMYTNDIRSSSPVTSLDSGASFPSSNRGSFETKTTTPPRRYTESSLIKAMKDRGIGRPSTYASIVSKVKNDNQYARQNGGSLVPTLTAFAVIDMLEQSVPDIVDLSFTREMEASLDEIASGQLDRTDYLDEFYTQFSAALEQAQDSIDEDDARTIPRDDISWDLRVGAYGGYLENEGGDTISIPDDVAYDEIDEDWVQTAQKKAAQTPPLIGHDSETGQPLYRRDGPYGPYIQRGTYDDNDEGDDQVDTVSVPDAWDPEEVSQTDAEWLLKLPITAGQHPERGEPILKDIGPYGPYIRCEDTFVSVDSPDELRSLEGSVALERIRREETIENKGYIRQWDVDGENGADVVDASTIELKDGPYGPYLEAGSETVSVPEDHDPSDLSYRDALHCFKQNAD